MLKKTFTFILALTYLQTFAQDRYVVQLTDKNNSPFSISAPQDYLSPRAIQRRINQNIAINLIDLPVNPSYITGIAGTGAVILSRSKWLNTVTVQTTSQSVLNAIQALSYVSSVNNVGRIAHGNTIGADKFSRETLLKNNAVTSANYKSSSTESFDYGFSLNQVAMLGGDVMHNNGYTGEGIIIAVIDAGFNNADNMDAFDSLRANNQILGTWDFVSNNANVYDDDSHGSFVLSIIGANLPGNLIGTAPKAQFWLLRSEDNFNGSENIIEEYNWAAAAEFADSAGADIINTSLGYTTFDISAQDHTYADMDGNTTPITRAADLAASKGMVVEVSAGNEGNGFWHFISAPADGDSVIATGAVDEFGDYVSFSSAGPSSDGRIKPNVAAQGAGTYVAATDNSGVFPGNGTSFSGPLISGMVATLWQCHPGVTNMQIINAIQQSASQAGNPDDFLGYGIPNFPQACVILGIMTHTDADGEDLIITGSNPVNNFIDFAFYSDSNQNLNIRLYDLLGNILYSTTADYNVIAHKKNFSIPASGLKKGMYLIQVYTDNNKTFTKKVVKY